MVFVSLGCTVSVQETTASSLKQPIIRTSLAPQKGARRSLDVCTHVLATQVTSPDAHSASPSVQNPPVFRRDNAPLIHWTPAWTKALQTKFSAVWDRWQKLSAQLAQYKALRPDWVGHTQELFDQQLQRFLSSVGATATARPQAPASTVAAPPGSFAADATGSRPVTLTPYLTVADEVEVSFAAMLADLCNMAYEVDKLDPELLEAHHHLSLIATSMVCSAACPNSPGAAAAARDTGLQGFDSGSEAEGQQVLRPPLSADHGHAAQPATAPGVVSFSIGHGSSPALSPSISMLELTTPEAVTAALTSQGHGAAFAHPVYVSTLHQALASLGSYDEEGDILDLELRTAAAVAAGSPHAVIIGGGGAAATGGVGSLGTMGTLDEISLGMLQQQQHQQHQQHQQQQQQHVGVMGDGGTLVSAVLQPASLQTATLDVALLGRSGAAPSGTLFSDVHLSEDRDFVAGQVYGYNTQLVERRRSSGDGYAAEDAAPQTAVTQSGAAGGRALREEQSVRRRASSSGGGAPLPLVGEGRPAAGMGVAAAGAGDAAFAAGEVPPQVPAAPPVVVACTKAPPSAWFCCDDKLSRTRYFAIQGSTSLEHWKINMQFEPVIFEDPKYGVRIHRGVYEAAKVLYDDLLPLVQEHVASSPYATVSFAGHSLGGSLGTVLMLLFVVRGVLKPTNISPVYTFGAPAVFCQGAVADAASDRCARCTLNCEAKAKHHPHHHHHGDKNKDQSEAAAAAPAAGAATSHLPAPSGPFGGIAAAAASMEREQALPLGLMAELGLSDDHVVNVIMHKDIVPRAFMCDYTAVAGVLQRWMPSLRDHHSLKDDAGPHKSLYNFVGRVAVLRPSPDLPFVNGTPDATHPMLPNRPALYRVGLPEETLPSLDYAAATMASWDDLLEGLGGLAAIATGCRRNSAAAAARRATKLASMQKSVMQFMNQPHPLTTLSDYQAYGPNGCISRFHNPDNYTRALKALSGR